MFIPPGKVLPKKVNKYGIERNRLPAAILKLPSELNNAAGLYETDLSFGIHIVNLNGDTFPKLRLTQLATLGYLEYQLLLASEASMEVAL